MVTKFVYKFMKSVVPCMLLTLSIGFCYAWSLFSPLVVQAIPGSTTTTVQLAFCLNIFFLGMGAAFFGPLVEKHIKLAAVTSSALLFLGLQIACFAVSCQSLWLLWLGIGVCCGLSEGCGYVVPVKNLLLWWNKSKNKGFIAAISIIFFGLGSTFCSWIFGALSSHDLNVGDIFWWLSVIYLVPTTLAWMLIGKPKYALRAIARTKAASIKQFWKDKFFWKSWTFMFLNIAMGLVLIGTCATILKNFSGLSASAVVAVMMACGIANGAGRLVFPVVSDFMKSRLRIWKIILRLEVLALAAAWAFPALMPIAAILINACYGAAFATLPSVLNDHYGKEHLSEVHGFVLSAWGFASLFAYCVTLLGVSLLPFTWLLVVLAVVYAANYLVVRSIKS